MVFVTNIGLKNEEEYKELKEDLKQFKHACYPAPEKFKDKISFILTIFTQTKEEAFKAGNFFHEKHGKLYWVKEKKLEKETFKN